MRQFSWYLLHPKFVGVTRVRQVSRHLCLEAAVLEQLFMACPAVTLTFNGSDGYGGGKHDFVHFESSSIIKVEFTGNVNNQLHFKLSRQQPHNQVGCVILASAKFLEIKLSKLGPIDINTELVITHVDINNITDGISSVDRVDTVANETVRCVTTHKLDGSAETNGGDIIEEIQLQVKILDSDV